jgi:hypothetical protein
MSFSQLAIAAHVNRCRSGQILKVGLLQASVASLTQPEGSSPLSDRPFYACSPGVEGGQFFGIVAPPQANWIALVLFL